MLRGVDLELCRGEIVGLVGRTVRGKSTLTKILSGALTRDGGKVERFSRIGHCPQDPCLTGRREDR